jgi:hypothetical protein
MRVGLRFTCLLWAALAPGLLSGAPKAQARTSPAPPENGPAQTLSDALAAACRANQTQFANFLTRDNASAFRALTSEQRADLIKRFSLADDPGKPLLSSDAENHIVLNCETPGATVEFRLGDTRVRDNLAFIPVTVVGGQQTQFGLVRENGTWRVLSLGLLLLDIPALSNEWAKEEIADREDSIVTALRGLKEAIERYKRAFDKLPDSLAQLGPADPGQISPEQASLVGKELAAGAAGGYHFRYRTVATADPNNETFELIATPDDYGKSGRRSFFLDGAGRIHAADKHGSAASSDDPEIGASETQESTPQ